MQFITTGANYKSWIFISFLLSYGKTLVASSEFVWRSMTGHQVAYAPLMHFVITLITRDDMNMQVHYRLSCHLPGIYPYIITIRMIFLIQNIFDLLQQTEYVNYFFFSGGKKIGEVAFGHHQSMSGVYRITVIERHGQRRLSDDLLI